jgi:TfoX/Sxy family transcriptional regulator of competence genes
MATAVDFIEYVCGQLESAGDVRNKKMFGEYMVYLNGKPVLLVCDNTVFVKILPCLDALMASAEKGFPYKGAKEHYILDVDDVPLSLEVTAELEKVTPIPKPKSKKKDRDAVL